MTAYFVLGLVLPWLAGWATVAALAPSSACQRYGSQLWMAGLGYFLGVVLTGLLVHLHWWLPALPLGLVAGLLALLGATALWRARQRDWRAPNRWIPRFNRPERYLLVALVGVTAFRLFLIGGEVLDRPTFPWDAWGAWAYKAQALALTSGEANFLPINQWVRVGGELDYPLAAHHYPTLIAAHQYWLFHWLGHWQDNWMNIPWLFALLSLAMMLFGLTWQRTGRAWLGMLVAYALISLPILNTHTALAGYMDIWVALSLLGCVTCLLLYREQPGKATLALGLVIALGSAFIKVESLVWLVLMAGVTALLWAPKAVRIACGIGAPLFVAYGLIFGMEWSTSTATLFAFDRERILLPYIGEIILGLAFPWQAVAETLLLSWNWHLLFPALAIALIAGLQQRSRSIETLWLLLISLAGVSAIGFLFFATNASAWAESLTSFNRIILQWVPVWMLTAAYLNSRERPPAW